MGILYSYIFGEENTSTEGTYVQQAEDSSSTESLCASSSSANEIHDFPCSHTENLDITTDTHMPEIIFPPSITPDNIDDVDKKNIHVFCAGKSKEFFIFPAEKISVLLQDACDWARKKPEKMHLVFEGEHLDEMTTIRSYPRLRGGSEVFLVHKYPHTA